MPAERVNQGSLRGMKQWIVFVHGFGSSDETWTTLRDALDRKSTRLNSSHIQKSRMPSSA